MIIYRMNVDEKNGKKWVRKQSSTDSEYCMERFATDMRAKYLDGCNYITRIVRTQHYDYAAITVYQNNGIRATYVCNAN